MVIVERQVGEEELAVRTRTRRKITGRALPVDDMQATVLVTHEQVDLPCDRRVPLQVVGKDGHLGAHGRQARKDVHCHVELCHLPLKVGSLRHVLTVQEFFNAFVHPGAQVSVGVPAFKDVVRCILVAQAGDQRVVLVRRVIAPTNQVLRDDLASVEPVLGWYGASAQCGDRDGNLLTADSVSVRWLVE